VAVEKRQGERNAWYTHELVVVMEHRPEVLRVLERWKVGYAYQTEENESRDLGLALIPLLDDTEAMDRAVAAGVKREAAEHTAVADLVKKATGRAGAAGTVDAAVDAHLDSLQSGMDRLLWALRTTFAGRNAGWMPTLGKNRLGGDVEGGNGHISHTSLTSPEESEWRPEQKTRPTEPGLGVRVGVLDTSMSPHPWLAGGLVGPSVGFLAPEGPYPAEAGHGTFVAGLVMQGAPGCVIEFRKVLSDEDGTATSWDVAKKIVELGRSGVDVLNLSLGCYTEDGQPPLVLATAIDRLDPDIVVVAAAGNHGNDPVPADERRKPAWPAALDDVIAVGSADAYGVLSWFSPREVPWIDVLAPGEQVGSTFLQGRVDGIDAAPTSSSGDTPGFNGFAAWTGSSFAAALVSGAIAARTVPGQRPAREAWRTLLEEGPTMREEFRAKLVKQGREPDVDPRFLPLLDD
jgi:hypothetical protein